MNTYDKIVHSLGLAATGLIGANVAMPKTVPTWLVVVALVVASVAQVTTNVAVPAVQRALARFTKPAA
jgi:hypothetical protein